MLWRENDWRDPVSFVRPLGREPDPITLFFILNSDTDDVAHYLIILVIEEIEN